MSLQESRLPSRQKNRAKFQRHALPEGFCPKNVSLFPRSLIAFYSLKTIMEYTKLLQNPNVKDFLKDDKFETVSNRCSI